MISTKIRFLHLVMGEIGGVGKSWFTKILIEAYISLLKDYIVIDADESTPNVGITYDPDNYSPIKIQEYNDKVAKAESDLTPLVKTVTQARLAVKTTIAEQEKALTTYNLSKSGEDNTKANDATKAAVDAPKKLQTAEKALESARKKGMPKPLQKRIHFIPSRLEDRQLPNEILDWMLERERDAIVNLPAQVTKSVNSWIRSSGLLESEMLAEGIKTVCWFVGKPSIQSIEQLIKLREFHGDKLTIVLVKNHYEHHTGSWSDVLTPSVLDIIESMKIVQIDLPHFGLSIEQQNIVDDNYVRFCDLVKPENEDFKHLIKTRLKTYLKHTTEQIVLTKLIQSTDESGEQKNNQSQGDNQSNG